ncbi:MAG TPA: heavy metal-binding domain-containing protein [Burkholderiales bacterium]
MPVMTGLSGNELYCLSLKGYTGGDLVLGNSVHSLGFLGGIGSAFQSAFGGEVTQITEIIADGRRESYKRMVDEATRHGGVGITSVTNSLRHFAGNIEFLSVASCLHKADQRDPAGTVPKFTTSGSGQALYCLLDAGYTPKKFVFGNVAYSVGIGGGLLGGLKSMARGEIREFSDIFNRTRHAALERVTGEARRSGANCVLGIVTEVGRFQGAHEMLMTGTAAHHPGLPASNNDKPATSDLTCEELWNLTAMGYAPVKLVLATAVYSLGVVGNVKSLFKSFVRGEISDLTTLIYDAREHALAMLHDEAQALGADEVVGIKTHIHELGSLIEFMAIGTAVKKMPGFSAATPQLPPQAIMTDRDTWISSDYFTFNTSE